VCQFSALRVRGQLHDMSALGWLVSTSCLKISDTATDNLVYEKFELLLTRCTKAYSSSGSVV